jgi:hypothetical protein
LKKQTAQKHQDALDSLKKEIKMLESKTPEDLWLSDLELFGKSK